jgi:hypothetical protein
VRRPRSPDPFRVPVERHVDALRWRERSRPPRAGDKATRKPDSALPKMFYSGTHPWRFRAIVHAIRTRRHRISKNVSGQRIRKIRLARKMTQLELSIRLKAADVKITRSGLAKIEMSPASRHVLDYELAGFAKALRVPVARLLGG